MPTAHIPPATFSISYITGAYPIRASSWAQASPAGPAPTMVTGLSVFLADFSMPATPLPAFLILSTISWAKRVLSLLISTPYFSVTKRLSARMEMAASIHPRLQAASQGAAQMRPQIEASGLGVRAIQYASSYFPAAMACTYPRESVFTGHPVWHLMFCFQYL